MNGLSYRKISKMPKKMFWENGGILCFGSFQSCFLGEIVHLKKTAEKNFFRQQFGNHITILNQEMFFKGSEVFFQDSLKNDVFTNFVFQVKFHPSKHSSTLATKIRHCYMAL